MLKNPLGGEINVRAEKVPDWISNSSVRMLISARKSSEFSSVEADLIAAVSEFSIQKWEREQNAAAAAKRALEAKQRAKPTTSRSGSRTTTAAFKPITGPIGKAARQLSPEYVALVPSYTAFIKGRNKKLSQADAQAMAETILALSAYYGVDPRLIVSLILVESGFDPKARSHVGAQGLGQLMPGTAKGLGVSDAYNAEQNLFGTIKLVRKHMDKYTKQTGDPYEAVVLTLAAYNAGAGAVKRHGGVPPYKETKNHIKKVMAVYEQLTAGDQPPNRSI